MGGWITCGWDWINRGEERTARRWLPIDHDRMVLEGRGIECQNKLISRKSRGEHTTKGKKEAADSHGL